MIMKLVFLKLQVMPYFIIPKFIHVIWLWISNIILFHISSGVLNEQCSLVVMKNIPTKMQDPRHLTLPCKFKNSTNTIMLAYSGKNINLMPYSLLKKLNIYFRFEANKNVNPHGKSANNIFVGHSRRFI